MAQLEKVEAGPPGGWRTGLGFSLAGERAPCRGEFLGAVRRSSLSRPPPAFDQLRADLARLSRPYETQL